MISKKVYKNIVNNHEEIEKISLITGRPNLLDAFLNNGNFSTALAVYTDSLSNSTVRKGRPASKSITDPDEKPLVAMRFIVNLVLPMWYHYMGRTVEPCDDKHLGYALLTDEKNKYRNLITWWFKNDYRSRQIDPFVGKNGKFAWLDIFSALQYVVHFFSSKKYDSEYFRELFCEKQKKKVAVRESFADFYESYTKFITDVAIKRTIGFYIRNIYDLAPMYHVFLCIGQDQYADTISALSECVRSAQADLSRKTRDVEEDFLLYMEMLEEKNDIPTLENLFGFAKQYSNSLCQGKHQTAVFELFKYLYQQNLIVLTNEGTVCNLLSKSKYHLYISKILSDKKCDSVILKNRKYFQSCVLSMDCYNDLKSLVESGETDYKKYIYVLLKWSVYEHPSFDVLDALLCDACEVDERKMILWDIEALKNVKHSNVSDMRNKLLATMRMLVILSVLTACEKRNVGSGETYRELSQTLKYYGLKDLMYSSKTCTEGHQFDWCVSKYIDSIAGVKMI